MPAPRHETPHPTTTSPSAANKQKILGTFYDKYVKYIREGDGEERTSNQGIP